MEAGPGVKNDLITLKQLFEDIEKNSGSGGSTKIGDKPPDSLSHFLVNKEEMVSNVANHIAKQKEDAIKNLEDLENKIHETLANARVKILYELEKQNQMFVASLKDYEG